MLKNKFIPSVNKAYSCINSNLKIVPINIKKTASPHIFLMKLLLTTKNKGFIEMKTYSIDLNNIQHWEEIKNG